MPMLFLLPISKTGEPIRTPLPFSAQGFAAFEPSAPEQTRAVFRSAEPLGIVQTIYILCTKQAIFAQLSDTDLRSWANNESGRSRGPVLIPLGGELRNYVRYILSVYLCVPRGIRLVDRAFA